MQRVCLQEEFLLPEQWVSPRGEGARSGVQRLMAAVLLDAVSLAVNGKRANNYTKGCDVQDAQTWIRSNARGFLTYLDTCEVLGIDGHYLREGVERAIRNGKRLSINRYPQVMRFKEVT